MSLSCRGRSRRVSSTVRYAVARLLVLVLGLIALAAPARAQDPEPDTAVAAPPTSTALPEPTVRWLPSGADAIAMPPDLFEGMVEADQASPAPEPEHTGLKALFIETGRDFKAFPRRKSTWVILGIGAAGALLVHPADDNVNESLTGSDSAGKFFAAGKYIGSAYVQAGAAIGLYVIGRYGMAHPNGERTNKVSHLGFDMLRALFVSQILTQAIKVTAQRDRPTGECCAFPSGHASAAFATASVLERHLGYRGAWPTFALAGYVAISRLADNRHYLSDVVVGSALGIASGWTVVGRHGRSNYALMPVPVRGGLMVNVTRKPKTQATN
jgi:membrane-associated phospholipid phosphatase